MRLIRFALPILLFSLLVFPSGVFAAAGDPSVESIQKKLETAINATGENYKVDLKKHKDPATFIGNVLKVVLTILNTVFFILIIYAGILWMTAKGDETQAKKARDTIIAAVIGVILVLASYSIVKFIFKESMGNPDAACTNMGTGYTCKLYNQCGTSAVKQAQTVAAARTACTGSAADCHTGKCPSDTDVICCK